MGKWERIEALKHTLRPVRRKLAPIYHRIMRLSWIFKNPYHFPIKEIWNYDQSSGWTAPALKVITSKDRWLQLEICGFRFFWPVEFDTADLSWIYHEVFTPGNLNPHSYEFSDVKIRSGEWVVDGGAGEGFFVQYALQRGANVLAVEPVKLLCQALSHTFEQQIQEGRVRVLQGTLSEDNVLRPINMNPKPVGLSTVATMGEEWVKVYTIDSILSKGLIPSIGFIKLDITGAELVALRGANNTLRTFKPRLAIAVYHELENARYAKEIVLNAQPEYNWT